MTIFTDKAPKIMAQLMKEFNLLPEDAAAILGNLGHESGGFKFLQEKKPLIPGSKGGYGWAQWTGPRRNQYEKYCAQFKIDPMSDQANYGFLVQELKTTEAQAIPAVKSAVGLSNKVKAFENSFERAGVKSYDSRTNYAKQALTAYNTAGAGIGSAGAVVAGGAVAAATNPSHGVEIMIGIAIAAAVIYFIVRWYRKRTEKEVISNVGISQTKSQ